MINFAPANPLVVPTIVFDEDGEPTLRLTKGDAIVDVCVLTKTGIIVTLEVSKSEAEEFGLVTDDAGYIVVR